MRGRARSGDLHDYRFTLYAIDQTSLNLTGTPTFQTILNTINNNDLASASLTGVSDARRPPADGGP